MRQQQQITKYGAFNEAIVRRELRNSIQTVVLAFDNSRLVIDGPTSMMNQQHTLQQKMFQTFQIGSQTVRVNVPAVISQLMSGDFAPNRINEKTVMVNATAMIRKIEFDAVRRSQYSWQQKLVECGRSKEEITKFLWIIEKVLPDMDNVGDVLDEVLIDWSPRKIDDMLGLIFDAISNYEQTTAMKQFVEGMSALCLVMENLSISADDSTREIINFNIILLPYTLYTYRFDYHKICSASFNGH